jgi:hypothetical protein
VALKVGFMKVDSSKKVGFRKVYSNMEVVFIQYSRGFLCSIDVCA